MDTRQEHPRTTDELFVGYAPAFRSNAGWRHTFRPDRTVPNGGVVRRVTLGNIDEPHKRLLVDVAEFPTAQLAGDYLQETKEDANVEIARGPEQFGLSALAYPGDQPRSLYFARANLMVWIYSCGRTQIAVVPWAEQIVKDFDQ